MLLFILLKIIACAYFRDTKLNICDFLKKKKSIIICQDQKVFSAPKIKKKTAVKYARSRKT